MKTPQETTEPNTHIGDQFLQKKLVASNELLVVDILGKLSGITAKVLSCQRKEDSGNSQKLKHEVQGNPTTVVNTHLPISTTNNWWTKIINIKCAATYATLSCYCF